MGASMFVILLLNAFVRLLLCYHLCTGDLCASTGIRWCACTPCGSIWGGSISSDYCWCGFAPLSVRLRALLVLMRIRQ